MFQSHGSMCCMRPLHMNHARVCCNARLSHETKCYVGSDSLKAGKNWALDQDNAGFNPKMSSQNERGKLNKSNCSFKKPLRKVLLTSSSLGTSTSGLWLYWSDPRCMWVKQSAVGNHKKPSEQNILWKQIHLSPNSNLTDDLQYNTCSLFTNVRLCFYIVDRY